MYRRIATFLVVLTVCPALCLAEVQTWTDVTGRTMEAEFVKVDGANIVFIKDGKEIAVAMTKLSIKDRARAIAMQARGGADPFKTDSESTDSSSSATTGRDDSSESNTPGSDTTPKNAAEAKKELGKRRLWTDSTGQTSQAKYVRMHEGQLILNRSGRIQKVPFYNLSEADQSYMTEMLTLLGEQAAIPPKPRKNNERGGSGNGAGYNSSGGTSASGGAFPGGFPGRSSIPQMRSGSGFFGGRSNSSNPSFSGGSSFPDAGSNPGMEEYGSGLSGDNDYAGAGGANDYGPDMSTGVGGTDPSMSGLGSGTGGSRTGIGSTGIGSGGMGSTGMGSGGMGSGGMGSTGMGSTGMGSTGMGSGGMDTGMSTGMGTGMGGGSTSIPDFGPKMEWVGECTKCKAEFTKSESAGKTHCPKCGIAWVNQGGKAGTKHNNSNKSNPGGIAGGIGALVFIVVSLIKVLARR